MAEVRWTPQAASDLENAADFIAKNSPHYASLLVMDFLAAVSRLAAFPRFGRMVPEVKNPAIREIILGNYRVVYRLNPESVEVLAIHHAARLLDPTKFGR